MWKFRLYCGPGSVAYYATKLAMAGYSAIIEGTEHVHMVDGDHTRGASDEP
jgi:hypothetical protein